MIVVKIVLIVVLAMTLLISTLDYVGAFCKNK